MDTTNAPYPLISVDKAKVIAVAQRALIAADSLYFSWPAEQQEHFRVTMNDDARNRVQRTLLDGLLGIQCSLDQVDAIWRDLPLTSLATYFVDEIESAGDDLIGQLIPHKYIDGADNGKAEKGGVLWDIKLDANGHEGQLDELRKRWYGYQQQRWIELSETFNPLPPAVYTQDQDWDNDPHRLFIFNNAETLKQIRWQHFLSDGHRLMSEHTTLHEKLKQEVARATSWLTENYQEIIQNFDPTVVKLQKKRKIILSSQVRDDLNKY